MVSATVRPDRDATREANANRYDRHDNPDGVFTMNVAENKVAWADLKARIRQITCASEVPDWTAGYADLSGHPGVRASVARFLARHLVGAPVEASNLALVAGASAALDVLAFALGDPGDVVAIPAPSYPVYTHDFGTKAEMIRYDIVTHHEVSELGGTPLLTVDHLDQARNRIAAEGRNLRCVVLTSPDNPTGLVYSTSQLEEMTRWCLAEGVHLVVNEIYGLSLIDTEHPDLRGDYCDPVPYSSFGRILLAERSDLLHHVYAFSKDFGISGFRIGVIHSANRSLRQVVSMLNTAHMVSNHTQWILGEILDDDDFIDSYVADSRERLTNAYALVVTTLRRCGIPYVPSRGSLFVWADFSEFLDEPTLDAERRLWDALHHKAGVLLTPGEGFGHTKRGMFRIVFPAISPDDLPVALERLQGFVGSRRAQ